MRLGCSSSTTTGARSTLGNWLSTTLNILHAALRIFQATFRVIKYIFGRNDKVIEIARNLLDGYRMQHLASAGGLNTRMHTIPPP